MYTHPLVSEYFNVIRNMEEYCYCGNLFERRRSYSVNCSHVA